MRLCVGDTSVRARTVLLTEQLETLSHSYMYKFSYSWFLRLPGSVRSDRWASQKDKRMVARKGISQSQTT